MVVSNILYFHCYLGKIPILANIFQRGWNHQPARDPITETDNGFMEPTVNTMRFRTWWLDTRDLIIWEYDDWCLGTYPPWIWISPQKMDGLEDGFISLWGGVRPSFRGNGNVSFRECVVRHTGSASSTCPFFVVLRFNVLLLMVPNSDYRRNIKLDYPIVGYQAHRTDVTVLSLRIYQKKIL